MVSSTSVHGWLPWLSGNDRDVTSEKGRLRELFPGCQEAEENSVLGTRRVS